MDNSTLVEIGQALEKALSPLRDKIHSLTTQSQQEQTTDNTPKEEEITWQSLKAKTEQKEREREEMEKKEIEKNLSSIWDRVSAINNTKQYRL